MNPTLHNLLKKLSIISIVLLALNASFIIGVVVGSQLNFDDPVLDPTVNQIPPVTDGTIPPQQIDPGDGTQPSEQDGCVIGGCSGQLCIEAGSDSPAMSTCEWREEYACYQQYGTCERQKYGECGWTMTPELDQCLQVANGTIYFEDQSFIRE